jgi:aminopeptidase N
MEPANRRIEPWTATLLGYLNHHLRQAEAVKYIYRGLEEVQEVQRTGDIFFPRNWAGALLGGHTSDKAKAEVERFLCDHPDYPRLLRNKILQAADMRRPPHE